MTSRTLLPVLLLALLALAPSLAGQLSDARLDEAVAPALEQDWLVGAALGQLTPDGESLRGFGTLSADDTRAPDGDTLFEIGSITKVFTGLLLADAVVRGELTLETTVAELLPEGVELGVVGEPITLLDLSTHTSGLPRLPGNLSPTDPLRPFDGYGSDLLLAGLDGLEPQRAPGESYEYSNLGAGLLGWLVAHNAGSDYETLLRDRVLQPLGMHDTTLTLDERLAARFAPPHDVDLEPSAAWDLDSLAGAGGIRSSVRDMLRFARFAAGDLEPDGSETLTRALALSMAPRRAVTGNPVMRIGLGWHINIDLDIWWHNGQTGGYHSMLEVIPDEGLAVIGLANTSNGVVEQLVDRLMGELMGRGTLSLELPGYARVEVDALERFVGRYSHPLLGILVVSRDGERLSAQLGTQPNFRVWPESARRFHYRIVDAQLEFDEGEGESASPRVVLYQNGAELPFVRLEDDEG